MFWLLAAGMTIAATAFVLWPLFRVKADTTKDADHDLQLYKDQLAELERDVSRGVLSSSQSELAKIEVSRRMLAADKRAQAEKLAQQSPPGISVTLAIVIAVLFIGGSFGLYNFLGGSAAPDQPLQARLEAARLARLQLPSQEEAEATAPVLEHAVEPGYRDLVQKLRQTVAARPDDLQGHRLLASHEAGIGDFSAARKAQQRVLTLLGDEAGAADYTDLAEYMVYATGGYVSPQAQDTLQHALKRNPGDAKARYYSGLALAQNGRPDVALRMWTALLKEGPADAPWVAMIQNQIPEVARAAGVEISTLTPPGPSAEDIEGAAELSPEERQEMIRAMVSRLSERLSTEGGGAREWARLIRAYGVLGETRKAATVWQEAQDVFGADPAALTLLRSAAQSAEVAQ